jgi:cysteinyl-tRNA synthetase
MARSALRSLLLSLALSRFSAFADFLPTPMTLRIFNSLTRQLEPFAPLEPGHVRMYVCGMTVYDLCHVGHARSMVAFDVVQRWLRASGLRVTYVRNITDIDDKIIKRALENGETISQLTGRMIAEMYRDADALGVERPTHDPHATDYVPQMLSIVEQLEAKGLAYRTASGDVNYAVRKFPGYGKLSGKSLDDLNAGERVAVAGEKQDPLDFVLWKSAKDSEPAEAKWPSAYGLGRPGWHIECSAMCGALLGQTFDIHGGGGDLQFPHHENEIAQSEGATGQPLARFWMHNGFINIDNEKMSKSLGNFFTIREVLEKFDAETVRFFVARAHYRSPLNYSDVHLHDARGALKRLYTALQEADVVLSLNGLQAETQPFDVAVNAQYGDLSDHSLMAEFAKEMNNDFNTSAAVAVLFTLASDIFVLVEQYKRQASSLNLLALVKTATELRSLGAVLGLLQQNPSEYLRAGAGLDEASILALIEARAAAKKAKNFTEADRIRAELLAAGVAIKDTPQGTTWAKA